MHLDVDEEQSVSPRYGEDCSRIREGGGQSERSCTPGLSIPHCGVFAWFDQDRTQRKLSYLPR